VEMKSLIKNKRGDISSIIIVIAMMFIIGILVYSFLVIFNPLINELKGVDEISKSEGATTALNKMQNFVPGLMDIGLVLIFVGFLVGIIISSIYINTIPGLTIFFIIVLIIAVFLSAQFANVFYEFRTDPEIATAAASLPISNFVLGKMFPVLILVTGLITIWVLYGKGRESGTQLPT